jgi:prolyl-tRNA synthetase
LVEEKAVEVGNIFPLGSKYSDDLGVFYTDENGQQQSLIMGCYGIGVSRLAGLLAEHFADDKGLVWPEAIAPFKVYLARLGSGENAVKQADELYNRLTEAGVKVLYDDRDLRPGEKFADADLLGMPYRVVVSDKTAESGAYELKKRTEADARQASLEELLKTLS